MSRRRIIIRKRNDPFLHWIQCSRLNSHSSRNFTTFRSKIAFERTTQSIQVEIGQIERTLFVNSVWLKNFLNALAAPKWEKRWIINKQFANVENKAWRRFKVFFVRLKSLNNNRNTSILVTTMVQQLNFMRLLRSYLRDLGWNIKNGWY